MNRIAKAGLLAVLLVAGSSCAGDRVEKSDSGGILLSVSDFDELPITASVNATNFVQVGSLTIRNVALDPAGSTSDLMDVELRTYQVTYRRVDRGTRVPPALVSSIFGTVPVNGSDTIDNLPIMTAEQLRNPPLSDLLAANGGFDKETGASTILLEAQITFFGRTLAGKDVQTQTAAWRIEITR